MEIIDGTLWACDKWVVATVDMHGLMGIAMSVRQEDVAPVAQWLRLFRSEVVTVREHSSGTFLAVPDGVQLGIARPIDSFPLLNVDAGKDPTVVTLDQSGLKQCLRGPKNLDRVAVHIDGDDVYIEVAGMTTRLGAVSAISTGGVRRAEFRVKYLRCLVKHHPAGDIRLELYRRSKGRYALVRWMRGEDKYRLVLILRSDQEGDDR